MLPNIGHGHKTIMKMNWWLLYWIISSCLVTQTLMTMTHRCWSESEGGGGDIHLIYYFSYLSDGETREIFNSFCCSFLLEEAAVIYTLHYIYVLYLESPILIFFTLIRKKRKEYIHCEKYRKIKFCSFPIFQVLKLTRF